jgi:hypothetical protein
MDAAHRVEVDQTQSLVVLDIIRAMECRLEVINFDFEQQGKCAKAAYAMTDKKIKQEPVDDDDDHKINNNINNNNHGDAGDADDNETGVSSKEDDDDSETDVAINGGNDEDDKEDYQHLIKQQNEQLLLGLTKKKQKALSCPQRNFNPSCKRSWDSASPNLPDARYPSNCPRLCV